MNRKNLALLLALVFVLGAVLTACGGGGAKTEAPTDANKEAESTETTEVVETSGDVIVWNIGQEPKTWDPVQNTMSTGSTVVAQFFEGLTYPADDGIRPGVAESWEIAEDNVTWIFHLREDAKWSDGQPVTAHDFVYSWTRMADPMEASGNLAKITDFIVNAQEFFDGKVEATDLGVKATDDYTLEVTLKNPTPFFADIVSTFAWYPTRQDVVENGDGWEKKAETAISNGPFKLGEYVVGSHITFVKNEEYWDAENVNLEEFKGVFIVDPNTAMQAAQAGDIDVNDQIPTEEIQRLMAEEPYLHVQPWAGLWYLVFNNDTEPFNNVNVRKAFALAIDRKSIVENVTKAGEIPATGAINVVALNSEGNPYRTVEADGYPPEEYGIDPRAAKVEEAQALLAEAGYPNGEGFPKIEMMYNTSDANKKVMEAIQQMLKENLNIDTTLANMESNVYFDYLAEGNFTVGRAGWIGTSFNVNSSYQFLTASHGSNMSQWRYRDYPPATWDTVLNPEQKKFDDLYNASMSTTGAERDKYVMEAEAAMMEEMPIAPIYYYAKAYYINEDNIENLGVSPEFDFLFRDATSVK